MTMQIIIFIIVMLGYAVSFIFKKLQEQAALKRAKEERERRRVEELRTGRVEHSGEPVVTAATPAPAPPSHQDAARRLQEIAERRRQQLEELRRRALGQGSAPTAPPPSPPVAPPSAQPTRQPARVPRQGTPSAPARSARPPSRAKRQADQPSVSEEARPERRTSVERETSSRGESSRSVAPGSSFPPASLFPQAPDTARRTSPASVKVGNTKLAASDMRRAMILMEVLSPPVSLRDEARH